MQRINLPGRFRTLALATLIALPALQLVAGLPAEATEPDPSEYSFKYSNGLSSSNATTAW